MKKIMSILCVSCIICGCMFVFTLLKANSMTFTMKTISGQAEVLDDVEIFSSLVFSGQGYEILVQEGTLSYEYKDYVQYPGKGDLYIAMSVNEEALDLTGIEFKEVENTSSYFTENGEQIIPQSFEAQLESVDLLMRIRNYDTYGRTNGVSLMYDEGEASDLKAYSTDDVPLLYVKEVYPDELGVIPRRESVAWSESAYDVPCFKIAKDQYLGMPQISSEMKGTAHIYNIELKAASTLGSSYMSISKDLLTNEMNSVLDIPIELGTRAFLNVYKDHAYVILHHNNQLEIRKYTMDMELINSVQIPLIDAKRDFQYFIDGNKLILQTDSIYTVLDIEQLSVVDQTNLGGNYRVEDVIYRNGRLYFAALNLDVEEGTNVYYDRNAEIFVYENNQSIYVGEVYLKEERKIKDNLYINNFNRMYTTFVRNDL